MKFGKVTRVWILGTNLQFLKVQKISRDWIAKQKLDLGNAFHRAHRTPESLTVGPGATVALAGMDGGWGGAGSRWPAGPTPSRGAKIPKGRAFAPRGVRTRVLALLAEGAGHWASRAFVIDLGFVFFWSDAAGSRKYWRNWTDWSFLRWCAQSRMDRRGDTAARRNWT